MCANIELLQELDGDAGISNMHQYLRFFVHRTLCRVFATRQDTQCMPPGLCTTTALVR